MRVVVHGLSAMALAAGLAAGLAGCATITRGSSDRFTIQTTPPDARAHTSTGFTCESTPCSIRMPRKDKFTVTVTKAGYKTVKAEVKPIVLGGGAATFVGNALLGGVVGAAVDVTTGAAMDLQPNPLKLILEPEEPAPTPAAALPAASPAPAPATPAVAAPAPAASPKPVTPAK